MRIKINDICGNFAENKDEAKKISEEYIKVAINKEEKIILDFDDIDSSTQSFVHASISEVFQNGGEKMLKKIEFKNCNRAIKSLITTVINYSLE